MTQIDTSRRGFLKSAVAASAAMMSAAAVHAGIPAKSVAKYDETFDVVIIGSGFAGMACALNQITQDRAEAIAAKLRPQGRPRRSQSPHD